MVLNNQYMPLSLFPLYTVDAEDAITRYLNGNCTVVEWYDRKIKTPSIDVRWPSVISNHNGHSFKKEVRLKKESLFYRDHCKCAYCGVNLTVQSLTFDHMIPTSKGGKHSFDNVVASCKACNNEKSDSMHPKWKPRHAPWSPTYHEMLKIRAQYPIVVDDESWVPFLPGFAAENVIIRKPFGRDITDEIELTA